MHARTKLCCTTLTAVPHSLLYHTHCCTTLTAVPHSCHTRSTALCIERVISRVCAVASSLQADATVHTLDTWEQRMALRRSKAVRATLQTWWSTAMRTLRAQCEGDGILHMDFATYTLIYKRIVEALAHESDEPYDEVEAEGYAAEDWSRDSHDGLTMTREAFQDSLFQIADLYTEEVDEHQYAHFLTRVLSRCVHGHGKDLETAVFWKPAAAPPTPKEATKPTSKPQKARASGASSAKDEHAAASPTEAVAHPRQPVDTGAARPPPNEPARPAVGEGDGGSRASPATREARKPPATSQHSLPSVARDPASRDAAREADAARSSRKGTSDGTRARWTNEQPSTHEGYMYDPYEDDQRCGDRSGGRWIHSALAPAPNT
jgi:hypothetical protein